jgi:hypothetical protein
VYTGVVPSSSRGKTTAPGRLVTTNRRFVLQSLASALAIHPARLWPGSRRPCRGQSQLALHGPNPHRNRRIRPAITFPAAQGCPLQRFVVDASRLAADPSLQGSCARRLAGRRFSLEPACSGKSNPSIASARNVRRDGNYLNAPRAENTLRTERPPGKNPKKWRPDSSWHHG